MSFLFPGDSIVNFNTIIVMAASKIERQQDVTIGYSVSPFWRLPNTLPNWLCAPPYPQIWMRSTYTHVQMFSVMEIWNNQRKGRSNL